MFYRRIFLLLASFSVATARHSTSTAPLPMGYASMGYPSMGYTSMGFTSMWYTSKYTALKFLNIDLLL